MTNQVKVFGDAAKAAAAADAGRDEEDVVVVGIVNGDEVREIEFVNPGPGQLAYIAMAATSNWNDLELIGSMINFLMSLIEDDSNQRYMREALLDRRSGFEVPEDLQELLEHLLEQWSSRPTSPSSDSSARRRTSGGASTARSQSAGSTRGTTSRSRASSR